MSPNQLTQNSTTQSLAAQSQGQRHTEEQEHTANASAQGGLNLNLAGALSGIFAGKKKQTTQTDADGKSTSVEHSEGRGKVDGVGSGSLSALGRAEAGERTTRRTVGEQVQGQERVEGQSDHLGIEGK